MGKPSRDKGKRGELEARDKVRDLWGCPNTQRSAQVSGKYSCDLLGGPEGLHLEVKRYAQIAASRFMDQAQADAFGGPDIPVVLMREDGGEWLCMFRMRDTKEFLARLSRTVPLD